MITSWSRVCSCWPRVSALRTALPPVIVGDAEDVDVGMARQVGGQFEHPATAALGDDAA